MINALIVCTANLCRSPMAEFLLRQTTTERGLEWQVGSAGTHASPGTSMHADTQRLLRSRGIETGDWRSRRVEASLLDRSDVILTASREHRSSIVATRPDLLARTFPLLQFAALAEEARARGLWKPSEAEPQAMIGAVRSVRGLVQLHNVDLADPVGGPYRRFRVCAKTIDRAIEQLLGP